MGPQDLKEVARNPARVFVFRGARMDCNECGGYREGLVLSPPAGLIADPSPLCLFSAFPPGASLFFA
jgi:hypothetical protein